MIIELSFTKGLLFGECISATILSERSTSGTEILHEIGFMDSFCLAILVPGAMIEQRSWILGDRISSHLKLLHPQGETHESGTVRGPCIASRSTCHGLACTYDPGRKVRPETASLSVDVTNTGERAGHEAMQSMCATF